MTDYSTYLLVGVEGLLEACLVRESYTTYYKVLKHNLKLKGIAVELNQELFVGHEGISFVLDFLVLRGMTYASTVKSTLVDLCHTFEPFTDIEYLVRQVYKAYDSLTTNKDSLPRLNPSGQIVATTLFEVKDCVKGSSFIEDAIYSKHGICSYYRLSDSNISVVSVPIENYCTLLDIYYGR